MKQPVTIFKWIAWVMVVTVILFLLSISAILPSYQPWLLSHEFATALSGAQSVTFFEMSPYYPDLDTGTLVLFDVSFGSYAIAACFVSHHRVEVVQRDGSVFRFDICVHCRNFCFNKEYDQPIPSSWLPRLHQFFTGLGMPPKSDGEYQRLAVEKVKAEQATP